MTEASEQLKVRIENLRTQVDAALQQAKAAGTDLLERVEGRLREVTETLADIVADLDAESDGDENGKENA